MRTIVLSLLLAGSCFAAEPYRVKSVAHVKAMPAGTTSVVCDPKVSDEVLKALGASAAIEELDLCLCREITTAGLDALRPLKKLKRLNLDQCRQLGDGVLAVIGSFAALEDLNLNQGVKYTNNGLSYLGKLENLRSINLGMFWEADARGLSHILKLPKLEALELRLNGWVDDAVLKQIAEAKPGLRKLNLEQCRNYSVDGLAHVAKLAELRWLNLGATGWLSGAATEHIAKLTRLEYLNLIQNGSWKDSDLCRLSSCNELKFLGLEALLFVTGECFATWKPPKLEHLEMKLNELSPAGLKAIVELPSLKRLYIWQPFTDRLKAEHFNVLGTLKQVELLSLWLPVANDETLKVIAGMSSLHELEVTGCEAVTDKGVALLAALKKMTRFSVMSCPKVSDSGLDELRKSLPDCRVVRDKASG